MEYTPDTDGMAWLSLYLPGDTACAVWNRTTATARGLQGPDEPRTLTQLRPDIAASLMLGAGQVPGEGSTPAAPGTQGATGIGKVPAPRADVLVTVPVFALLGLTNEPAVLDGFGPIPASMARRLVADGADSFYRVLVDPRDGAPLEIGRKNYRLTGPIKHWIRLRDSKCTFPGCTNQTPDNDTDHLQAWEHGGTTNVSNLAQLCPKHHRLKHHSQWTPDPATTNEPPGWTSPTNRHYNPEQQDAEPTHWPPGSLPLAAVVSHVDASVRPGSRAGLGDSAHPNDGYGLSDPVRGLGDAVPLAAMSAGGGLNLSENRLWQQFGASMPLWHDPPVEEPPGENELDPGDLCPADPLWDEFHGRFYELPADPQADWQLLLGM